MTLLDRNIGLALSGGGVRAAAFHAGVLRRLAELRALERLRHVSSVSGGSLLVGLLNTVGQVMFPELAYFVIFGPMALLLAFRPLGLFGKAT